jgi:hypothetical protein
MQPREERFLGRDWRWHRGTFAECGAFRHRAVPLTREPSAENDSLIEMIFAVVRQHADSVLPLRIVFSICLVTVLLAGVYIFRIRKRLFDRDPHVVADHWAARNLRLWQVILVWLLAIDLLVTMLWRL